MGPSLVAPRAGVITAIMNFVVGALALFVLKPLRLRLLQQNQTSGDLRRRTKDENGTEPVFRAYNGFLDLGYFGALRPLRNRWSYKQPSPMIQINAAATDGA